MGANMDLIDLSDGNRLVTSGPAIDSRECVAVGEGCGAVMWFGSASHIS